MRLLYLRLLLLRLIPTLTYGFDMFIYFDGNNKKGSRDRSVRGAACGVGVRAVVCRVGRPFSGGRLGRARPARFWRVFGVRVSRAGDAVNDKYEKKTVPVMYICRRARISSISYYAYVRFVYYYLLGHVARY